VPNDSASTAPDPREGPRAFLHRLGELLDESGLDAVLIGAQARNAWAEPRATFDFDLLARADAAAYGRFRQLLLAAAARVEREQGITAPSGPDFARFIVDTGEAVDLQAAKTEYQELVLARGVQLDAAQPLRVASVEDLIVLKLIANRRKDQDDLFELGRRDGVDWGYIEHWTEVWQVTDPLRTLQAALAGEG
jgi:hypothetical protein